MRRAALIFAGGALWLLLAAVPVLADGGPHVATINNGTGGINADSCAGCHRAHTAQTDFLTLQEVPDLCLTCHGAAGTGATTDVESGIQYTLATRSGDSGVVLGALRGGGFVDAAINTSNVARLAYTSSHGVSEMAKVGVLSSGGAVAPEAVTSTHMDLSAPSGVIAWGNGADGSDAGGTMTLNCTSCHNPHGNGQYRILNPLPEDSTGGTFVAAGTGVNVTDAADPTNATRNYTVIQTQGPNYLLLASDVTTAGYAATTGDYWHKTVPWNNSAGTKDAPNGDPNNFSTQITNWCVTCHTRYASAGSDVPRDDPIYTHEHNTGRVACTQCHVAHGSNATMDGMYSGDFPWPGGAAPASADSRLLKIDNRGTCQACHDPTGTIVSGQYVGPAPTPGTP